MIFIVRIQSQEHIENIWNEIIKQKDNLQAVLNTKGHILYLSKRLGYHNEASLFVHVVDPSALSDLIVYHLSKISNITGIVLHHLFQPKFFRLPRDTHSMKRFTISLKVSPPHLSDVYKKLIDPNLPDGLKKVYFAFTFHHTDDSLQFSLLADDEVKLRNYVTEVIDRIPGVIKTTVYPIEKTKPFISYESWQDYASQNASAPEWEQILTQLK